MNISPKRCVLVVDDDPGIRLLLATFLRRRGFQLLLASNGREAIAVMRSGKADVVVMDLMMPEVSGWEVLRVRAAEPALMAIPMIVVTANNSRQVTDDLLDKRLLDPGEAFRPRGCVGGGDGVPGTSAPTQSAAP